jgi:hypothetical protein
MDNSVPFAPDHLAFPQFLDDLPEFSLEERDGLEVPFTFRELEAPVIKDDPNKTPGLDNLSYEFYCAILPIIGPHLLSAQSSMLPSCLLSVSLMHSVVCPLLKVSSSFRCPTPSVEYTFLTKMFVACLLVSSVQPSSATSKATPSPIGPQ